MESNAKQDSKLFSQFGDSPVVVVVALTLDAAVGVAVEAVVISSVLVVENVNRLDQSYW